MRAAGKFRECVVRAPTHHDLGQVQELGNLVVPAAAGNEELEHGSAIW